MTRLYDQHVRGGVSLTQKSANQRGGIPLWTGWSEDIYLSETMFTYPEDEG